MLLIQDFQ
jgi:hypothetical protein